MDSEEALTKKYNPPLVSVVVVCYTGVDMTRRCLMHLFAQDYEPMEIIVVDNGSPQKIHEMIRQEFPEVRLICLDYNRGFAGGHNAGIQAALGKYVAIINNDAMAATTWVGSMVASVEKDDEIGSVASIIIDGNQPNRLDSCGIGLALDGMSRQMMKGEGVPFLTGPKEVLAPSGCACLFRMEALRTVGLFDESFFAYCEDTDLGLRLRWAGYKSVVAPGAEVTHYYSMTTGKFSHLKVYWVERNHYWVAVKNFPLVLLFFVPFVTVWRYIIQFYAIITRSGNLYGFVDHTSFSKIVMTIMKAQWSALFGILPMLHKRHLIKSKRKLKIIQMLKTIWMYKISIIEVIIGLKHAR